MNYVASNYKVYIGITYLSMQHRRYMANTFYPTYKLLLTRKQDRKVHEQQEIKKIIILYKQLMLTKESRAEQ